MIDNIININTLDHFLHTDITVYKNKPMTILRFIRIYFLIHDKYLTSCLYKPNARLLHRLVFKKKYRNIDLTQAK